MKNVSAEQAFNYVTALELPFRRGYETVQAVEYGFDTAKNQAMVVGSGIVSFVEGVTPERREDIVNSSLLAQLATKKKVSDPTMVYDWYNSYFDILTNIGWVIQDQSFATYSEESAGFEAHQAILDVAAVLLGPAATTMAIVKATLDALKSMSSNSPWITVFNRESQAANTAHFQITLAEKSPDDQFIVSLMAFGLEAKATLTQVLFFKARSNEATLKHYSGKVTINGHVLSNVREAIKNRIAGFAKDYVEALPPL